MFTWLRLAALSAFVGVMAGFEGAIPRKPEIKPPTTPTNHDLAAIFKAANKRRRKAEARLRRL